MFVSQEALEFVDSLPKSLTREELIDRILKAQSGGRFGAPYDYRKLDNKRSAVEAKRNAQEPAPKVLDIAAIWRKRRAQFRGK